MKRFTIILPEELHLKFKIACTLEGTDMSIVIREFMEGYSNEVQKRKLIPRVGKEK